MPPSRDPAPPGPTPTPTSPPPGEDEEARFDRWFETYYNPLRRYAYRYLRSWEEAEDLVHDVFVRLWARRTELSSIGDPSSYLYTATRNRCISRLKHLGHEARWRTAETARQAEPPDEALTTAERDLARREVAAAVQRALDELTPRQREAILLQWRGRTYDEIGAALGISPKTVSVHLSRAFETLRELLSPLYG